MFYSVCVYCHMHVWYVPYAYVPSHKHMGHYTHTGQRSYTAEADLGAASRLESIMPA